MPANTPDNTPAAGPHKPVLKRLRMHPRQLRFWLLCGFVLYVLGGFLLAPWLLERALTGTVAEAGRTLSIGKTRINPLTFSVQMDDVRLLDTDQEVLFSCQHYLLNFQLSSAVYRAWTFRQLHLNGCHLLLERFRPGEHRIGRLLADLAPSESSDRDSDGASELPPVWVRDLQINQGRVTVSDHLQDEVFQAAVGPVTVRVTDLNSLPDRSGQQQVSISTTSGGVIAWQGSLQLHPLQSQGHLELSGNVLQDLHRYAGLILPLRTAGDEVDIGFDYRLSHSVADGLRFGVDRLQGQLTGLQLSLPGQDRAVLDIAEIGLAGGRLRWPQNELQLQQLTFSGPRVDIVREADGSLELVRLLSPQAAGEAAAGQAVTTGSAAGGPADPLGGWDLRLQQLTVEAGRLNFRDLSATPAAELGAGQLQLQLDAVDNQPGTAFPSRLKIQMDGGGQVEFNGQVSALPELLLEGELVAQDVELPQAQPWLNALARISLDAGQLSVKGALEHGPQQPGRFSGTVQLADLTVTDGLRHEPLLGWQNLGIAEAELNLAEPSLSTSTLVVHQPYGRLAIAADKSTNVGDLLQANAGDDAAAGEAITAEGQQGASTMALSLGGFEIHEASLDFSDLSLPLPFAAAIRSMDGSISTLSNSSAEPAAVALEGQVNEYGLARIEGSINAWALDAFTDLRVTFRNLEMDRLTPYTIQFAGYRIDGGRMDLDLHYRVERGQMKGENRIVMKELQLGEKVEHPDALSLPLKLAVALLTDANGVIDIDLPVSGDINDPDFHVGGIVSRALFNLLTRVVTSPFRLLGRLVGDDSPDFGTVVFRAGGAHISPPDRETLDRLASAMRQRPELELVVAGVYNRDADGAALRLERFNAELERRQALHTADSADRPVTADIAVLEAWFAQAFPEQPLEALRSAFNRPVPADTAAEQRPGAAADTPAMALDELAYLTALRQRLVDVQAVGETAFAALAEQRSAAVIRELQGGVEATVAAGGGPAAPLPLRQAGPREVEADAEGGVPLALEVSVIE